MTEPKPKNVVSLDAYGQQRNGLSPTAATELLRECRQRVADRLGRFVTTMMDKVDDALFASAEKAESNTQQTHYFDAMREVRLKRADVETRFREAFEKGFTHGKSNPTQSDMEDLGASLNLNWDQEDDGDLGLLDHEQLEESLAITNMAAKIRGNCTTSLYALDQRIGSLLGDPELERNANPVGADAICHAFKSASEVIEAGIEIRLLILKLFDQHVVTEVRGLYQELNRLLVDKGVLPEIRAKVRVNPNAALPTPPQTPNGDAGTTKTSQAVASDAPYRSQGVVNDQPAAGAALVSTLTLLQRGDGAMLDTGSSPGQLGWDADQVADGTVNLLTHLKQAGITQDLGKGGDMTLDIVAMLFDYILEDRNIHDAMRAQIGRLQIPILKVALLDRDFFAKKTHPARRLLNALAAVAVGWSDGNDRHDPVYRKVSAIVQQVLDEFEDDIGLFERMTQELNTFLAQEDHQATQRAQRSAKIAQGRERVEVAKTCALDEVQKITISTTQLIQDFISTHWKNLLFITCSKHGKDSAEWKTVVQTMNDLIWSVRAKQTKEERKRLAAMQSGLLKKLRTGMAQLSLPETEQQQFLSQLVRAHGRTASTQAQPIEAAAPMQESKFSGPAVESLLAQQQVSLQEINRTPPPSTPPTQNDEYLQQAKQLKEGQWLELIGNDGKRLRAKLSWISPITGSYLFTDRQGLKAADLKPEDLAQALRLKRAALLNDAPLLDRAVSTVLKSYSRQQRDQH